MDLPDDWSPRSRDESDAVEMGVSEPDSWQPYSEVHTTSQVSKFADLFTTSVLDSMPSLQTFSANNPLSSIPTQSHDSNESDLDGLFCLTVLADDEDEGDISEVRLPGDADIESGANDIDDANDIDNTGHVGSVRHNNDSIIIDLDAIRHEEDIEEGDMYGDSTHAHFDGVYSFRKNHRNSDTVFTNHVAGAFHPRQSWREPAPTTMEMTAAQARTGFLHPHGAAADPTPPQIPLAPLKQFQARFNPLADWIMYLLVFIGGVVGTALRYGLNALFPGSSINDGVSSPLSLATFVVNTLACLGYGTLTGYLSQASWLCKRTCQLAGGAAGMGFWAAFSTMSTLLLECFMLLRGGHVWQFVGYLTVSFIAGIMAVVAGTHIAATLTRKRQAAMVAKAVIQVNGQAQRDRQLRHSQPMRPQTVRVFRATNAHHGASSSGAANAHVKESSMQAGLVHVGDSGAKQHFSKQFTAARSPSSPSRYAADDTRDTPNSAHGAAYPDESVQGANEDKDARKTDAVVSSLAKLAQPRTYEPKPVTDEIPLVANPVTGEVHG